MIKSNETPEEVTRFEVPKPDENLIRFARGMRQELGNILTPIMAFGELLEEDTLLNETLIVDVQAINESAVRGNELMSKLLKAAGLSRVEQTEMTVLDLAEIIEEAWDNENVKARVILTADNSLNHSPEQADLPLLADTKLVTEIIKEISSNSTRSGAENVLISIGVKNEEVIVRVSDDGCGVKSYEIEFLAKPYMSYWGGASKGLGLSVINGIVTSFNGTLILETDKILKGLTVEFKWPNKGNLLEEEEILHALEESALPEEELETV